jgi:hypothetical protein
MSIDFITQYPKDLTNSAWQKKKTYKDKTTKAIKKTGLGATLTAAEKAWKAIDFKTLAAKNYKPKNTYEAEINLANAKWTKDVPVPKAIAALKLARKQAEITSKNTLLSPAAQEAAGDMIFKLRLMESNLKTLKLNDFKLAITSFAAKSQGGRALGSVTITGVGGRPAIGKGKKGIRKPQEVAVYEITWDPSVTNPDALVKQKFTLKSFYDDNSDFINDMTLTRLSNTKKTAFFGA